jgi:hypothetical protein
MEIHGLVVGPSPNHALNILGSSTRISPLFQRLSRRAEAVRGSALYSIGQRGSRAVQQRRLPRSVKLYNGKIVEAEMTAIVNQSAGRKIRILRKRRVVINPEQIIEVLN